MTADLEFEIRDTARDLQKLYAAMDELKHIPMKPPEVRTMQNTGGNPSMPGTWLWMHRSVDMEQKLREVAHNAFADIKVKLRDGDNKIPNLLELIALNAQPISELPWANDFYDELTDQARTIGKWTNPPETGTVASKAEQPQSAKSICYKLRSKGHYLPEERLYDWARRGKISQQIMRDGKPGYLMTEIMAHL